jgi:hypothetical protein
MSFKAEVIADATGKWQGNGLRFATRQEAEANVLDLAQRWGLVRDTRVVECNDPVNYRWCAGRLMAVALNDTNTDRTSDVDFWREQVEEQRNWILSCGGSLAAYIGRYGSRTDVEHYGLGGEAIYAADMAELRRCEAMLAVAERLQGEP